MPPLLCSTREAAAALDLSVADIRALIRAGVLRGVRPGGTALYRIQIRSLEEFQQRWSSGPSSPTPCSFARTAVGGRPRGTVACMLPSELGRNQRRPRQLRSGSGPLGGRAQVTQERRPLKAYGLDERSARTYRRPPEQAHQWIVWVGKAPAHAGRTPEEAAP